MDDPYAQDAYAQDTSYGDNASQQQSRGGGGAQSQYSGGQTGGSSGPYDYNQSPYYYGENGNNQQQATQKPMHQQAPQRQNYDQAPAYTSPPPQEQNYAPPQDSPYDGSLTAAFQEAKLRDALFQSPYLSQQSLEKEQVAQLAYATRPPMSKSDRNEMQNDLMQAFSYQLLNDEELSKYSSLGTQISVLSGLAAFMIPIGLVFALRPHALPAPLQKPAFWALGYGTVGAGFYFVGTQQADFHDTMGVKYFGKLSDDNLRTYRALYESHMRQQMLAQQQQLEGMEQNQHQNQGQRLGNEQTGDSRHTRQ